MHYVSTRGEAPALGFSDAVLAGLARDGGLYVPREWPRFSPAEIRAMRGLAYPDLAIRVLLPFLGGVELVVDEVADGVAVDGLQ